jgi:hypothetical protein
VFELNDELVNIGHGAGNEVALTDPAVEDYQASITSRNGRYAIYTPLEDVIAVDGNLIPAERWVWLPPKAQLRVGGQTALQFRFRAVAETPAPRQQNAVEEEDAAATPAKARSRGKRKRSSSDQPEKSRRNVARFITDQGGDTLVTLGEDGQLPELALVESGETAAKKKRTQSSNPVLLYVALGFSMLVSLSMLLIDAQPTASTARQQAVARQRIVEFYATANDEPAPYQHFLREAQLAHSRRDRIAERTAYRRVLSLLYSEDNDPFTGLTGSPQRDEELRKLLAVLLSE